MKPIAAALCAVTLAFGVLWFVGRASGITEANEARTAIHERNAAIVARAYRGSRAKTDTVLVTVVKQGAQPVDGGEGVGERRLGFGQRLARHVDRAR